MGRRAGIALGLLLGIGLTYELVVTQLGDLGVSISRHHSRKSQKATGPFSFCALLASGDKSGSWNCFNGDQTALSGSAKALASVGAPVVTTGSTCAAPSYTTLVANTSWLRTSTTLTTPSGDWTQCGLFDATTTDGYLGFGDGAGAYAWASEDSTGVRVYYSPTDCNATVAIPAGRTLVCFRWVLATHTGTVFAGVGNQTDTTACVSALTAMTGRYFWGCDTASAACGSHGFGGKWLGGFTTEKALSDADMARLSNAGTCL